MWSWRFADYQGGLVLAGAATFLSRQNSSFVATKACLSRQKRLARQAQFCCDKTLVMTNVILSRQLTFVATKHVFCRDKHVFVATNTCFRDKTFVATKITLAAAPASDSLEMWRNWQQSAAVDPTRCKPRYCCFHAFPPIVPAADASITWHAHNPYQVGSSVTHSHFRSVRLPQTTTTGAENYKSF